MNDIETKELKERLARAEQMNEASCRMLGQALDEIKRLNNFPAKLCIHFFVGQFYKEKN